MVLNFFCGVYIMKTRIFLKMCNDVIYIYIPHTSLTPIRRGFAPSFVNYNKRCIRLAAASDKVYQLLAHGRWFSQGTPPSSTAKTGRHNIDESGVKHPQNQAIKRTDCSSGFVCDKKANISQIIKQRFL
jgi:hypothetical protein